MRRAGRCRRLLLGLMAVGAVPLAAAAPGKTVVVAEGDSLTYGYDTTTAGSQPPINQASQTRSPTPYPETLGRLLGQSFEVVNHGFPGDRTREGLSRWSAPSGADIAILMYGTNDCLNYGGYPDGPLPLVQFRRNLQQMIARRRQEGARVVLVQPPALQDQGAEARLRPCRRALDDVGRATRTRVVAPPRTVGWTDGVHLSPASYRAIAALLAPVVRQIGRRSVR